MRKFLAAFLFAIACTFTVASAASAAPKPHPTSTSGHHPAGEPVGVAFFGCAGGPYTVEVITYTGKGNQTAVHTGTFATEADADAFLASFGITFPLSPVCNA